MNTNIPQHSNTMLQQRYWSYYQSSMRAPRRRRRPVKENSPFNFKRLVVPWLVVASTTTQRSNFLPHLQEVDGFVREIGPSIPYSTRRQYLSNTSTARNLFFERSKSVEATTSKPKPTISAESFEELRRANATFPFRLQFDDPVNNEDEESEATPREEQFVIRFMTPDDLPDLVPLCLNEFGEEMPRNLSWRRIKDISTWWEQFCFENLVAWTLNMKMKANLRDDYNGGKLVADPAMLVLTRKTPQQTSEQVIGMVELSLQPPDLNRNPPAVPLPLWIKESLAQRTQLGSLQGWISNVLIDPDFRGRKLAKVLMAATEGIAKSWGCNYIFLHADADIRSGRIPQKLYESLGYKMVPCGRKEDYSWAGEGMDLFSSVRMVDGVALICYSKEL